MKIFETNAALGYLELAYFIKTQKKGEYLCISTNFDKRNDTYVVGKSEILEDYVSKPSDFDIKNSPLYDTFLFNEFIKDL